MRNDSLSNDEIVIFLNADMIELLGFNILVLYLKYFIGLIIQSFKRVSHFQTIFTFMVLVPFPLATFSKE